MPKSDKSEKKSEKKAETESTADASTSKVTRNQQVVLTAPPTVAAMVSLVQPALERLTADGSGVRLLVLVPDADTALAVAQAVLPAGDVAPVLIPVTSAARGTRLMAKPPAAIVGAPSDLAALLPSGLLKLDAVTQVLMLQADLTLSLTDESSITTLMTELPKDIARTVTMAAETDAVTAFAKSYMKRPRRVGDDVMGEGSAPISLQYVLVSSATRTTTLRRVLDAVNAPSTIVVAPTDEQLVESQSALRALGYDAASSEVLASTGTVETHSVLRVLYDVPATRAALDAALGGHPAQVIALVTPRQVAHLRSLLTGGSLTYFVLPDTMAQAVGRDGARMGELRKILAEGVSARELAALESLLDDNDALEIAAAALRLLERERETAKALRVGVTTAQPKEVKRALAATAAMGATHDAPDAAQAVPSASLNASVAPAQPQPQGPPPEFQILWINIGSDDGATASSFVGAITGESGLDRSVVGSIDLRDSHTLVEVSGAHAEQIVTAMNGSTMRNRQVIARIDRAGPMRGSTASRGAAPRRGTSDRAGGGFSRDRGDRGDRPARPAFRRDEGGAPRERSGYPRRDDGDRPARPSFSREDRPARPSSGGFSRPPREGGFSRDDRPARPPREGGFSREDRPTRPSSGGFSRDERPARPSFPRDDRPARPPREGGFSREDRPARPSSGGFSRPPREGGFSRDDRPARPSSGGFTRAPREGGAPTGRGFTRDRSERPSGPRTEGNDFAERAERLRNSRKPDRGEG
ncbi:MAG TPA: DbpA RNA binding domain-containing protein [Gemmatimonadaceae bacterium]|nr:DbpA RNA binding domain-containing protein [Gemmatimonadaceae bacterium]